MDFAFFKDQIIRGFTYNFVVICSYTLYISVFLTSRKRSHIYNIKFLVTSFINQYNNAAFIIVGYHGAISQYSSFMSTCHGMNIVVQILCGDYLALNVEIKIPNKALTNITISIIINSSHNKYRWCVVYQYYAWILRRT